MLNKGILLSGREKLYNVYRGSVSHVSLSYSPQTDIKAGTRVNITVNANSGYQNPSVSVTKNDGTGSVTVSGSGSSRYFTMPKSDVTINASASLIPTYSVSGSASGGGISFSKTSGIRAGETVTVYLSPNSYYSLSRLTSSPSVSFSGSGNTRTFRMPSSNVRVTATFVAQYNLAIVVGKHKSYIPNYYGYDSEGFPYGKISHNSTGMKIIRLYSVPTRPVTLLVVQDGPSFPKTIRRLDNNTSVTLPANGTGASSNLFVEEDLNKTIYLSVS